MGHHPSPQTRPRSAPTKTSLSRTSSYLPLLFMSKLKGQWQAATALGGSERLSLPQCCSFLRGVSYAQLNCCMALVPEVQMTKRIVPHRFQLDATIRLCQSLQKGTDYCHLSFSLKHWNMSIFLNSNCLKLKPWPRSLAFHSDNHTLSMWRVTLNGYTALNCHAVSYRPNHISISCICLAVITEITISNMIKALNAGAVLLLVNYAPFHLRTPLPGSVLMWV